MSFSSLTVVAPLAVTPAMLVSTNVPETDYPEWAAGTTYAKGQRVILAAQHKVYESAADGNTGTTPRRRPMSQSGWRSGRPTAGSHSTNRSAARSSRPTPSHTGSSPARRSRRSACSTSRAPQASAYV